MVTVLALPVGLLSGLPQEDVDFLLTVPGTVAEVDELRDGDVGVMLRESPTHFHFIFPPGRLLRVIRA